MYLVVNCYNNLFMCPYAAYQLVAGQFHLAY